MEMLPLVSCFGNDLGFNYKELTSFKRIRVLVVTKRLFYSQRFDVNMDKSIKTLRSALPVHPVEHGAMQQIGITVQDSWGHPESGILEIFYPVAYFIESITIGIHYRT